MEYQDFELELSTQANGAHQVSVVASPAGEARQPITLGLEDTALRAQLVQIEQTLRYRANATAEQKRANLAAVKRFGGGLFDALLNDNLKSLYDQSRLITQQRSQGLRLKLRVQSPLLAALPWELLYDARFDAFLCTSRQLSIVRYVALPRPVQLLATRPPLNVLGVVSAPKNLPPLAVERERQQLEEALRPLLANGLATLTWLAQPNWRALLRAMRQGPWHVLHYIGHSGFDASADDGYLSLEAPDGQEERLTADQLGTLLADHGALRLVILNSCQGARIGQDIYASTATTLVQRGIPAVIGMQYDISDNAALEFALTFYETLAENVPIETALAEARKAISLAVDESVEWGTAVFYTHAPQSVLFDMPATRPVVNNDAPIPVQGEQANQAANLQGDTPMDQPAMSRIALYDLIESRYNDSELQQLCFRMGVNYEDLGGSGRADKIRELVMYCERHVLTAQLQQQALAQQALAQRSPAGQPPRPAGDTSAVDAWVAALQGCATMVSHERRNDVVRDLPLYIQGNIERRTALYDDVYNIARTCLQYADGMQALVAAIRKREGPTVGVQQLEALL